MIYHFPKYSEKLILYGDNQYRQFSKLEFQERVVISIVSNLLNSNPKMFDEFGPNLARNIWNIASFLSEERFHYEPKK